jgi:exonuclease III
MDTNSPVNSNKSSKILIWNVRGINSQDKWDAIRGNITESDYQVLCLQETKRAHFDSYYIKNFCPKSLDHFAFSPSIGASGDLLTI